MPFINGQFSTGSTYQDAAYGALAPQQQQGYAGQQPMGDQPAMTQAQIPDALGFQQPTPQPSTLDKILPWVQAVGNLAQVGTAATGAVNAVDTAGCVGGTSGANPGTADAGGFDENQARVETDFPNAHRSYGDGTSPALTHPNANPGAMSGGVGGVGQTGVNLPAQDSTDAVGVNEGGGFWDTWASGAKQGAKFGPLGTVLGAAYGGVKGIVDIF